MYEKRVTGKFFALILVLVMTIAMSGMMVSAEGTEETDYVASVGENKYETIEGAISEAKDGGTITLLQDVTDVTIPENYIVTIDLNGKTISSTNNHTVTNKGTLTVIGTGTVTNTVNGKAALCNNGTAYLNGGSFVRNDSSGNSYYTIVNHGTMTIDGATVSNDNTLASCVENGWYSVEDVTGTATLIVKNGTITGGLNAVKNDNASVLDVQGGAITNDKQYAIMNYGIATVSGGEITCTAVGKGSSSAEAAIYNHNPVDEEGKTAELTVNGGTITGGNHGIYNFSGNVTISGTAQVNAATYALYSAGIATVSDEAGKCRACHTDMCTCLTA